MHRSSRRRSKSRRRTDDDNLLLKYTFELIQNISSTQQLSDTLKFKGTFLIQQIK